MMARPLPGASRFSTRGFAIGGPQPGPRNLISTRPHVSISVRDRAVAQLLIERTRAGLPAAAILCVAPGALRFAHRDCN
jgi:hypothetical protein